MAAEQNELLGLRLSADFRRQRRNREPAGRYFRLDHSVNDAIVSAFQLGFDSFTIRPVDRQDRNNRVSVFQRRRVAPYRRYDHFMGVRPVVDENRGARSLLLKSVQHGPVRQAVHNGSASVELMIADGLRVHILKRYVQPRGRCRHGMRNGIVSDAAHDQFRVSWQADERVVEFQLWLQPETLQRITDVLEGTQFLSRA